MAQTARVTIVYEDGSMMTATMQTLEERIYPVIFAVMENADTWQVFDSEGKEYTIE